MDRIEIFKILNGLALLLLITGYLLGNKWVISASGIIIAGAMLELKLTDILAKYWMKLVMAIGTVISTIVLSLIFLLVYTPYSVIYRFFNSQAVRHFFSKDEKTYFYELDGTYDKERFENLW